MVLYSVFGFDRNLSRFFGFLWTPTPNMYWITIMKQPALKSRAINTIFKGDTDSFWLPLVAQCGMYINKANRSPTLHSITINQLSYSFNWNLPFSVSFVHWLGLFSRWHGYFEIVCDVLVLFACLFCTSTHLRWSLSLAPASNVVFFAIEFNWKKQSPESQYISI